MRAKPERMRYLRPHSNATMLTTPTYVTAVHVSGTRTARITITIIMTTHVQSGLHEPCFFRLFISASYSWQTEGRAGSGPAFAIRKRRFSEAAQTYDIINAIICCT